MQIPEDHGILSYHTHSVMKRLNRAFIFAKQKRSGQFDADNFR